MNTVPPSARTQRTLEILPGIGKWPIGGFRYAGGKVVLGDQIDILGPKGMGRPPNLEVTLGAFIRMAAGWTDEQTEIELGASTRSVLKRTRDRLGVERRHAMFPAALRQGVLRVSSHGREDFQAAPRILVQLGLLARNIPKGLVAAAYGIDERSVAKNVHYLNKQANTTSSITTALIVGRLGPTTCVPMSGSSRTLVERRQPIVPEDDWEGLVETAATDRKAFVDMFAAMGLRGLSSRAPV